MSLPPVGLFLDGVHGETAGRATISVRDPADASEVGSVVSASAADAHAAMESAERAQPAWEALGGAARARILVRAGEILSSQREELARLITREMGKVLPESRSEVDGAIDNFAYYAAFARTLSGEEVALLPRGHALRLLWLPRGVVVGLTPWNFPAATVTRKIAPALLGGNTMVLKPSSATPLTSLFIADALGRAGLPPGVLNVLPGPGAVVGPALLGHPACSTVTLTGSTESGIEVMRLAAPGLVKCLLELGGKAPVIVAADADLDWAARSTVWARFWNAGQSCIAAERTYVHAAVAAEFLRRVTALVRTLRVGPGLGGGVDMGPLYRLDAREEVSARVERAVTAGAHLEVGGTPLREGELARGAFYAPTVLSEVNEGNAIAREEVFGPVLPVLTFEEYDDVFRRANDSRYGLSSYLFTRDAALAERAQREIRFGETYINRVGPETPQGYHAGFRASGLGGEGSRYGVQDYLQLKTVYVDWNEPHDGGSYFPYPD